MDTATGECSSFELYRSNPTTFFMRRFAGMTLPVANFLVENVFCILDDPTDDSQRIGAREFGVWIRDLPTLLGSSQLSTHTYTHSRVPSTASISCHPLASAPASRRPVSRQASLAGSSPCRPPVVLRVISQSNVDRVPDHDRPDGTLSPALDLVLNEEDEDEEQQQEQQAEDGVRSLSTAKRRKRGRKGKGMMPLTDHTQTSERLALASQTLVRELSRQTRSTSVSNQSFLDVPPAQPVPVSPTVTKKQSRWKLSFGKSGGEATIGMRSDSRSTHSNSTSGSARATNVTNLIMGLNPTTPTTPQSQPPPVPSLHLQPTLRGRAGGHPDLLSLSQQRRGASPTSTRSGRPLASSSSSIASSNSNWRNSMSSTNTSTSTFTRYSNQSMRSISTFATSVSASSASSSTNWRNPQSPTFPSSSSLASSVHSGKGSQPQSNMNNNNSLPRRPPSNIKRTYFSGASALIPLTGRSAVMSGVPWELGCAPRELHQKEMDIFGAPPQQQQPRERERKRAGRGKGKQPATSGSVVVKSALEPINERPHHQIRQDAATSTTDLAAQEGSAGLGGDGSEAPRVHKAQINALAKMLSALRR
jgi:hypothetical protein